MNESERLADQLHRALTGDAWHGPSWREVLEGVGRPTALARPLPQAHSIAEIMLHTAVWQDVVRRRLGGETPEVSSEEDWPAASLPTDEAWSALENRLLTTGRELSDTVRRFPAERLTEKRPGIEGTWFELIAGELQHILYHAGQVGLLRKAGAPAA
jgi:hypothetical protein